MQNVNAESEKYQELSFVNKLFKISTNMDVITKQRNATVERRNIAWHTIATKTYLWDNKGLQFCRCMIMSDVKQ